MRTFLFATIAVLAVAPTVACAQSEDRQKIDTTFVFEKGGSVDLGLVSGDIHVTGWTKGEVKIYATIETGYFETTLSASQVRINAKSRRNHMGNSRIEISVPIGTRVHASSVSGNVSVRGTAGSTITNTVSGDLEVRDASDKVELHSVSGDIRAEKLRGSIRINSVSGDITLDDVSGDLRGKTVSGEMRVRGALTELEFESVSGDFEYTGDVKNDGTYSANTHSGDIRVNFPANVSANLDLQTFSGDLRTDFPLTLQPGDRAGMRGRQLRTTINGGGARISLATFSGNITIEKGAARPSKED